MSIDDYVLTNRFLSAESRAIRRMTASFMMRVVAQNLLDLGFLLEILTGILVKKYSKIF